MPFRSQAQRGWMHVHHPAMAKRWEAETPQERALPQHVAAPDHKQQARKALIAKMLKGGRSQ